MGRNAMFRRVGRGIWLGLHAGQALPASETLPTSVDPRRRSDPAAASGQQEFDWYYAELYAAPIGRVVRVAKKLQLVVPCCVAATSAREAVTIASIGKAQPREFAAGQFDSFVTVWPAMSSDCVAPLRGGRKDRREFRGRCYHDRHG